MMDIQILKAIRAVLILSSQRKVKTWEENFHVVVGNPPFGDTIKEGDEDQLGKKLS